MALAKLHEAADIAIAAPVELAFLFFVMNPEEVGGHDLNAAGFHFQQFVFPLRTRIAGEMELAHHRQPGLAAAGEIPAGSVDFHSLRIRAAHLEMTAQHFGLLRGELDGERGGRIGGRAGREADCECDSQSYGKTVMRNHIHSSSSGRDDSFRHWLGEKSGLLLENLGKMETRSRSEALWRSP